MEAVWSQQSEEDNDQPERNPNALNFMIKDDEGLKILYVITSSLWWWVIEVKKHKTILSWSLKYFLLIIRL